MRIFITSSYGYWGNFLPTDLDNGTAQIGGGETAMIQIARELAKRGNEVIVFYPTRYPGRFDGVDYVSPELYTAMVTSMEADVLVSWDAPFAFRFADLAKLHVLAFQLNDADIGSYDWTIDLYLHPSQWHANMFHSIYPEMKDKKSLSCMTNGIDPRRYVEDVPKVQHRVIYSSSPDRGLHHLLRVWPKVVEQVPDAELHVFYDIKKWLELDAQMGEVNITHDRATAIREFVRAKLSGVTFHGGIGQGQLAKEQLASSVLAYPCDPIRPTEGFSMTILEGITAGCHVLTTDADALPELWGKAPGVTILPLPVDDAVWTDALVNALNNPTHSSFTVNADLLWSSIAAQWEEEFRKCLEKKQAC